MSFKSSETFDSVKLPDHSSYSGLEIGVLPTAPK